MWTDLPLKTVQQPERKKKKRQTLAGQPLFPVSNLLICPAPLWFHYIPAGDTNQVTGGKTSPAWAWQVTVGPEGRLGVMIPYGFLCRDPLPVINYHLRWAHNVIYRVSPGQGACRGGIMLCSLRIKDIWAVCLESVLWNIILPQLWWMFVVMGMEMESIPIRSVCMNRMFLQKHASVLG